MNKNLLFLFAGMILAECAGAAPLIRCSFDRGIHADSGGVRGGDVAGSTSGGVKGRLDGKAGKIKDGDLRPAGVSGKALLTGKTEDGKNSYSVSYSPLGGLAPESGAVSFWVSPVDWNGKDKRFHIFFSAAGEQQQMIIYKYHSGEKILFFFKAGKKVTAVEHKISDWKPGEFHHIAANWTGQEISLYVDGALRQSRPLAQKAENPFTTFTVGNLNYFGNNAGKTLIDELEIFSKPLTDADIAKCYAKHSASTNSNAPLLIGVTEKTPELDGVVNAMEYSFAGSGFWNLSTRKYAIQQAQYFLAKDKKNFYIAVISPAANLKSVKTRRDDAIWEDDSIEVHLANINGGKERYQFIFNAKGAVFDSRDRKTEWNANGIQTVSRHEYGKWTIEAKLPIANFSDKDLQTLRLNICRAYRELTENTTLGPCIMSFADYVNFAEVRFHPDYPRVSLSTFGDLNGKKLDLYGEIRTKSQDTVSVQLIADTLIRPFQFKKSAELKAETPFEFHPKTDSLPENKQLEIEISTKEHGTVYRNALEYADQKPLNFAYLYTDLPERILNLVCRNSRTGGTPSAVTVCFYSMPEKKLALKKSVTLPTNAIQVIAKVPLKTLEPGSYRMEFQFAGPDGKSFFESYELYHVTPEKAPWDQCQDGISDEVPRPWTDPLFSNDKFQCWGRTVTFGGGILNSIRTQGTELLSSPVALKLGEQTVPMKVKLVKQGKSFAEYLLSGESGNVTFQLKIKAEFDGLLWCDLTVSPKSGTVAVRDLSLQIPLKRQFAAYFDNCRSAGEKIILKGLQKKELTNDLSIMPFFWIGSDSVGLMAGMPNLKGWYLKNKSRSMVLELSPETVTVNWNLIAEPLNLNTPRKISFYFHPTPVKPKNKRAARLRDGVDTQMWTGYWSSFYEFQNPDYLNYEKLDRLSKTKKQVFHYCSAKGASSYSPDWNMFGKTWISSPPGIGEHQVDSDVSTRDKRNYGTFTYGCLNCRSFLDYKIWSLARMIENKRVNLNNLYFDIAWPRSCGNPVHGCAWKDEFGDHQTTFDIAGVREFYLRIYKLMQKKNPDVVFAGHLTSTRTPADSFFDILVRGEVYDRKVVENGSYINVFNPLALRISEASRSNEQSIWMLSQFTRSLLLFRPALYKQYDQKKPETDRAIMHYLGYLLLHDLVNWGTDVSIREKQIFAAQNRLGWDDSMTFHPYWEAASPVRILNPDSENVLLSSYVNGEKIFAILLNDTDQPRQTELFFEPFKNGTLRDVFTGAEFQVKDGKTTIKTSPRGVVILTSVK